MYAPFDMSRLVSIAFFLWFLVGFTGQSDAYHEPVCNINPYGTSEFNDCAYLLETFANSQDAQLRIFDEEQLRTGRDGSWPGIVNPFSAGVVQVLRFWSKSREEIGGSCTMAD